MKLLAENLISTFIKARCYCWVCRLQGLLLSRTHPGFTLWRLLIAIWGKKKTESHFITVQKIAKTQQANKTHQIGRVQMLFSDFNCSMNAQKETPSLPPKATKCTKKTTKPNCNNKQPNQSCRPQRTL